MSFIFPQVLISSGLRFRTDKYQDRKGRIFLFDFTKPNAVEELDVIWKNDEKFFKEAFNPHGIDAFTTKAGKTIVLVVNHNPEEAIER